MRNVIREFETQRDGAPDAYGDSGCRLTGLNEYPLVLRHERYPNELHDSIYLFARQPEVGAQVILQVFPDPARNGDYARELEFYVRQQRDFRLPHGQTFDETFLSPSESGFRLHDAFRTRDGRARRRVVHAFAGEQRKILLVYSLDSNEFLGSRFFASVCKGLILSDVPVVSPFKK